MREEKDMSDIDNDWVGSTDIKRKAFRAKPNNHLPRLEISIWKLLILNTHIPIALNCRPRLAQRERTMKPLSGVCFDFYNDEEEEEDEE